MRSGEISAPVEPVAPVAAVTGFGKRSSPPVGITNSLAVGAPAYDEVGVGVRGEVGVELAT